MTENQKNGGSRRCEPVDEADVTARRDSPPGRQAGVSLKSCQESTAKVDQEAKAGPDPRGLHATAGLLRTIERKLASVDELNRILEGLPDRLEKIDTALELLTLRVGQGPRERCSVCKAKLVGR